MDPSAGLRCSLTFASCYIYAPRGTGLVASGARLLCQRVKASDPLWLPRYARCVIELTTTEPVFGRLLGGDAWLVPVPGSTRASPMYWAAWQLAMALHELGLARGVWPGLVRESPVRKSATAFLGERPTVYQHYGSFAVVGAPRGLIGRMILVDDVITKGRTLLAAAARLRDSFPHADVRAFALVRTVSFLDRIDRVFAPCEGRVYWAGGDSRREP